MDTTWLYAVNHLARATGWAHPFVLAYADFGVVAFAVLLLGGWWAARRTGDAGRMAAAWSAGISVLVAVGVNQPLVALVARQRPYATHSDLLVLAHRTTDLSCPSDHATMAGAAFVGLLFVGRRLAMLAGFAAITMAFSRVYIAAHYPADVAAGLVLGAAVAIVVYAVARRALTRLASAMARTRWRPLVAADPVPAAG